MFFVPRTTGAPRRAGRRGGALRAALGVAVAVPLALAGTQTGLAGTHAAGTGWVLQPAPPAPAGARSAGVGPVSCASRDACMAVGNADTTSAGLAFTDAWNGTNWTLESIPNAAHSELFSVSCPATAGCVAVGRILTPQAETPLAETWNGTSWSARHLPLPPGQTVTTLNDVSCTTPARCVAVGYDQAPGPVSESWNGTTWTPHTATLPGGAIGEFLGVSCRSYRSCIAVGFIRTATGDGPMAASWNGRRWTVQDVPTPSGSTESSFESVSCHSVTDCMAAGTAGTGHWGPALAEHWDGTAWTIVSTARLGGASSQSGLYSVSCPRARRCTAVGQRYVNGTFRLVVENWNGTRWRLGVTVVPPFTATSYLSGVSCLAKQGCVAVGGATDFQGKSGLMGEQRS